MNQDIDEILAQDMDAWTMIEIEGRMRYLAREILKAAKGIEEAGDRYARACNDHKNKYSQAMLKAKVTNASWAAPLIEAQAHVDTKDEHLEMLLSKELKAAAKARMLAVEEALSTVRSVNTNIRSTVAGGR